MLFLESDFSVRIISVFSPSWSGNHTAVAPRPFNALSFRLSGNAVFTDGERRVETADSDMVFMPEGVGYHLHSGAEKIIAVHFELLGKKQNFFESFRPEKPERFRELFLSMCEAWENKKPGYILHVTSLFYRVLEEIVKQNAREGRSPEFEKIREAVFYMNTHYTDSTLTVKRLCELAGVSDTYFRRLFYREFGMTPVKYLTELRVAYAAELLESGYYSVRQVALECGFSDPKYFGTVFCRHMGKNPSDYRK